MASKADGPGANKKAKGVTKSEERGLELMRERARLGSYTEERYLAPRRFFSQGASHAHYEVAVEARNGRPKVIEFDAGWQVGVTPRALSLRQKQSESSYEIRGVEGLTASEWDKKGLSEKQIEAAASYLQELKARLKSPEEPAC